MSVTNAEIDRLIRKYTKHWLSEQIYFIVIYILFSLLPYYILSWYIIHTQLSRTVLGCSLENSDSGIQYSFQTCITSNVDVCLNNSYIYNYDWKNVSTLSSALIIIFMIVTLLNPLLLGVFRVFQIIKQKAIINCLKYKLYIITSWRNFIIGLIIVSLGIAINVLSAISWFTHLPNEVSIVCDGTTVYLQLADHFWYFFFFLLSVVALMYQKHISEYISINSNMYSSFTLKELVQNGSKQLFLDLADICCVGQRVFAKEIETFTRRHYPEIPSWYIFLLKHLYAPNHGYSKTQTQKEIDDYYLFVQQIENNPKFVLLPESNEPQSYGSFTAQE